MEIQNPAGKHFCIGMTCGGIYYGKQLFISVFVLQGKTPLFSITLQHIFKMELCDYRAQWPDFPATLSGQQPIFSRNTYNGTA